MSERITGYRKETLQSLTTGAGVCFENFDLATDTFETGKKLGATSGGVTVSVEYPDAWDREIDGLPSNAVGMHEQEFIKPVVTASFVEVSNASILRRGLGGASVAAAESPSGYQKVTPNTDIATADYLENITVFTRTKGGSPLIIVIKNPLSTEGFEFETVDKEGGSIEMEFTGNYDPLKLDECPIEFYVPNTTS